MSLSKKTKKLEHQEEQWSKEKQILEREYSLKEDKRSFEQKYKRKKMSTSKKLITFLFVNCTVVELFVLWVTVQTLHLAMLTDAIVDFTPLVTLVGAIVSEVIGYAVYAIKSAKENCAGGVTYLRAQAEMSANAADDQPSLDAIEQEINGIPQG